LLLLGLAWPGRPAAAQGAAGWEATWDNDIRLASLVRLAAPAAAGRDAGEAFEFPGPRRGITAARLDWRAALNLQSGGFGVRVGGEAWVDMADGVSDPYDGPLYIYRGAAAGRGALATGLPRERDHRVDLRDAFLHGTVSLAGDDRLSFRLGRHVVLWGESLYFPGNGVAAAQAPLDGGSLDADAAYRARDVFLPVGQLSASWQPAPGLALQGYYQFEYRRSRLDTVGSYGQAIGPLSTEAAARVAALLPGTAPVILLPGGQHRPPGQGQFGAALKGRAGAYSFGLYAARYHAKQPVPDLVLTGQRLGPYGLGATRLVYPAGIQLFGVSLARLVGETSVAAELSVRRRMPFATAGVVAAPGEDGARAVPRGDSWHAQLSWDGVVQSLSWLPGGLMVSGELAGNGRLGRPDNPGQVLPGRSAAALAVRTVLEPRLFQILAGVDLTLPVAIGYNLAGRSPVEPLMTHGTGDVSVGASLSFGAGWQARLTLTHYLGAPAPAALAYAGSGAGRPSGAGDFLSLSLRRVF
jgi:hypothetical protein